MKKVLSLPIFALSLAWATIIAHNDMKHLPVDNAMLDRASIHGKYSDLLDVIEAPGDKVQYGAYCDWGYWYGDEYDDHTGLMPGFWVYVYPKWYIWGNMAAEETADPGASANGKYMTLMHVLNVPGDSGTYGLFYDWGFSEEYSYAGYDNLTPGYWVYCEPNWYVWADITNNTGGT